MSVEIEALTPICGPNVNIPAGGKGVVSKELADALVESRAAKLVVSKADQAKAKARATAAAKDALEKNLEADIKKVTDQLKKDCNVKGAVKADLEAAAKATIEALTAKANEDIAAL